VKVRTEFNRKAEVYTAGSCERGNEPLGSHKRAGNFSRKTVSGS
jgi:hypothetical protein